MITKKRNAPKRKQAPTANDLLNALDNYFPSHGGFAYVRFRELEIEEAVDNYGASYRNRNDETRFLPGRDSFSRIDYWVIAMFNGQVRPQNHIERATTTYSIEVKVDRRDFTKELRNPQKQRWALMYSNLFYYCAPVGLIKREELPPYAGLLEYFNGTINEKVRAPRRDAIPPRWTFVSSLLYSLKRKISPVGQEARPPENDK